MVGSAAVNFFLSLYNGLRLSNKAEMLVTHAENSLLSSHRPVSQQATTQICISNAPLAPLMFVIPSRAYNGPPPEQSPHPASLLIHSWTNLPHTQAQTDGRAQTQRS